MIRIRKLLLNNRGQSMVEFALLLPVLILILFGIIEFGRVFNASLAGAAAAREAARLAAVGDAGSASATVKAIAGPTAVVAFTPELEPGEVRLIGTRVTATVTSKVAIPTPVISSIIGSEINLTSTADMRVER